MARAEVPSEFQKGKTKRNRVVVVHYTFILVSSSLVYLRSFHVSQTVKLNAKWRLVSSLLTDQFGARNGTHEYWLDSFLPISGQLIFCRRILMMQMNRMKFICGETRTEFGLEREQSRPLVRGSFHRCCHRWGWGGGWGSRGR